MKLTQPSFTGGEISPSLYARVDLARYANSLKTCRNFIVSAYGGVYNRPGLRYINPTKNNGTVRLIPFQFNITQQYIVELGNLYARFYANGLLVAEIVTPWLVTDVWGIRYTQSADVLYLAHSSYPPQTISRTSATTFVIAPFLTQEGPFQPVNINQSTLMAASATTGNVTVTCNTSGTFSADMVGMFLYLENRNLSNIKPWTAGEKNVTVGIFRRNAGKTYQCIQVTPTPTGTGSYILTGGNAPQHDQGAQWDGPGDTRFDGTNSYAVGVLWQYVDAGYGIVKITGYTNSTNVTAVVTKTLPAGVIGGAGTASGSWTATGNGSQITFPLAGNISNIPTNYAVTIAGVPVQSDPNYQPNPGGPVGGGGGCVAVDSFVPCLAKDVDEVLAQDAYMHTIACVDHATLAVEFSAVTQNSISPQPCWRIESESGIWLIVSKNTRVETLEHGYVYGDMLKGLSLPVVDGDVIDARWEKIVSVTDAGDRHVAKIYAGDKNYLAGGKSGRYISTHNAIAVK